MQSDIVEKILALLFLRCFRIHQLSKFFCSGWHSVI